MLTVMVIVAVVWMLFGLLFVFALAAAARRKPIPDPARTTPAPEELPSNPADSPVELPGSPEPLLNTSSEPLPA